MIRVIIFCSFAVFANALIQCQPNACATVRCAIVLESDCTSGGGRFAAKGGYCGCCASCVHQLGKGNTFNMRIEIYYINIDEENVQSNIQNL